MLQRVWCGGGVVWWCGGGDMVVRRCFGGVFVIGSSAVVLWW